MDTIVTVAERNGNRGMARENRESNTNREQDPKTHGYYRTVAERNSKRRVVRENRKSNTNREQGPNTCGYYSNSSREK